MKICLYYIPTCGDELLKKSFTFHIIKGTPSIKFGHLFLKEMDYQLLNKTVEKYLFGHTIKCIVCRYTNNEVFVPIMLKKYLFVCVSRHYIWSCDHRRLAQDAKV